jgi:tetratricopeptide (TPR) repeat protein
MRRLTDPRFICLAVLAAVLVAALAPADALAQRSKRKAKPEARPKPRVQSIVVKQSFNNGAAQRLFDDAVELVNAKRYGEAASKFEETLPYLKADSDRTGEASVLNNVGVSHALGGDHVKAGEYYERSLEVAKEVGDDAAQAAAFYNLGVSAYKLDKDPAVILDYYNSALDLYRRLGNRSGEADTLFNIGEVYQWTGASDKAKEYYRQSLAVRTQ